MLRKYFSLIQSLTLFEVVTTVVVSVVIGVTMWGWTLVYDVLKVFIDNTPFNYVTSGFWVIPGLLLPFIIRKPGVALLSSFVAAFIQGLITQWGLGAVIYGLLQGAGAEITFALFGFKRINLLVLSLAGFASALLSYGYDYLKYDYQALGQGFALLQLLSFMISTIPLAAIPTIYLTKRLVKTGLLNQFLVVKVNKENEN